MTTHFVISRKQQSGTTARPTWILWSRTVNDGKFSDAFVQEFKTRHEAREAKREAERHKSRS